MNGAKDYVPWTGVGGNTAKFIKKFAIGIEGVWKAMTRHGC